ncbi:MAG TPA: DUF1801 domain-containing protein [Mucilaginibacter sp.]|jgi:hypothetical protein|nr:DUF1801 domain-containing protein [Mucilaginibacter sp.]
MRELDLFYLQKEEPVKGCLLFLRQHILQFDEDITEAWKYRMPFFCYKGKMFCYVWIHKKTGLPFLGMVNGKWLDHPQLIFEDRARIKIFLLDPNSDLPIETIDTILKMGIALYD